MFIISAAPHDWPYCFFNLPACFLLVFFSLARNWVRTLSSSLKKWPKMKTKTLNKAKNNHNGVCVALIFTLNFFLPHFFFVAENNLCWRAWVELVRGEKRWRWVSAPTHTLAEKTRADIHPTNFHPPTVFLTEKKNTKKLQRISMKGRPRRIWLIFSIGLGKI